MKKSPSPSKTKNGEKKESKKKTKLKADAPGSPNEKGGMIAAKVRGMVSMNKVRFTEEGFNLDLTYITPNVIAMGFPSHGTEGYYRNPVDKVEEFFRIRHGKNFRVYNLCSERSYDKDSRFDRRYKRFPFDDHNAPAPIDIIPEFVNDVSDFLKENKENVAAVHCKAGKGRTGVLIACYLMMVDKKFRKPKAALAHFASLRTSDGEGVTIPSQHRYVGYWETMLANNNGKAPPAPPLKISSLTVSGGSQWDLFIIITQGPERMGSDADVVFDSRQHLNFKSVSTGNGTFSFPISSFDIIVRGDVRVTFKASHRLRSSEHLFHFWFHTAFTAIGPHTFTKMFLDKAAKDKKHTTFKPNLSVTMTIADTPEDLLLRGEAKLQPMGTVSNSSDDYEEEEEGEEEEEREEEGVKATESEPKPDYAPVSPIADEEILPEPFPEETKRIEKTPDDIGFPMATMGATIETPPALEPKREESEEREPEPEPEPPRQETAAEKRLRELKEQREKRQKEREADRERRDAERKKAEEDRKEAAVLREAKIREEAAAREKERGERRKVREAERQEKYLAEPVTPLMPEEVVSPKSEIVSSPSWDRGERRKATEVEKKEKYLAEPVTPLMPEEVASPTSQTSKGDTQVVDLALNIIQRIKAIEKTCSKSQNSYVTPVSPSSPANAPLSFVALSLLQRSARLEVMCIQESEFRNIKNGFRSCLVG
eukprot:TRINITY_DN3770_c0_g3_i1.p1 TRINITY_DN3770_c0_g3~~TRINITY_DN3770_c0_g3_i1.p1  ORF type:complete len:720 (+),score=144.26 TRINITY_DN3770_c0_g3_i1:28-2160(+)